MGAIRGPDLTQAGAATAHDVGNAELAADLDELAAGNDDLFAVGERLEGQQYGRRVVVHDERVLRPAEPTQQGLDVAVARPALLRREIQLEIRVRGGHTAEALD